MRFASDGDDDALLRLLRRALTKSAAARRRVDGDLVGAGLQQVAHILESPRPPADRQRHEDRLGGSRDHVEYDLTAFVRSPVMSRRSAHPRFAS